MKKSVDDIFEQLDSDLGGVVSAIDGSSVSRRDFIDNFALQTSRAVWIVIKNLLYSRGLTRYAVETNVDDQVVRKALLEIGQYIADKYDIGTQSLRPPESL